MSTLCIGIGEFLKIDFPLVYRNSSILAMAYFLLIPVIRGISNLNSIQSAQCLAQSVSLIGIMLIVPIVRPETEAAVKEIIYTKSWSYLKSVRIRVVSGLLLVTFMILIFSYIMRTQNCQFPFWSFSSITILYAGFIGFLGLVVSQIGKNTILGYLSAVGYWSLCQLQIIQEGDRLYFFPIINGEIQNGKVLLLFIVNILLCFLLFLLIKRELCGKWN